MRNLILSGGIAHDYAATSPILAGILSEIGIASEIREEFDLVESGALSDFDLLTLNCVRWTCARNPDFRDRWGFELSEKARAGILGYLAQGKGLLALHCATICFDDWPEYRNILGAWWKWDHSGHGPYRDHVMHIQDSTHPITKGLEDFTVMDELYTNPVIVDRVDPLMTADWEEKTHPMLWVRAYGNARICYCAPGHGVETFENSTLQKILQRSALWVTRKL